MRSLAARGLGLGVALVVGAAGCDSLLGVSATFVDGSAPDAQAHTTSASSSTTSMASSGHKGTPKHDAGMIDAGHDATMGTMKKDGGSGKDAKTRDTGHPVTKDSATEDAPVDATTADAPVDAPVDAPLCTPSPSLASDPANCGRCFHDCLGGACSGGMCQPFVVTSLNAPSGYPNYLAVTQGMVYWTQNSSNGTGTDLLAVAKADGGNAQVMWLVTEGIAYGGVAVDSTRVYFVEQTEGVVACPLGGCGDGGAVTVVEPNGYNGGLSGAYITALAVTGSTLYTGSTGGCCGGDFVWTCPVDASSATDSLGCAQVTNGQYQPNSIAADEAGIVWSNGGAFYNGGNNYSGGQISTCPPGAECTTSEFIALDTEAGSPQTVAANSKYVFWTAVTGPADGGGYSGTVIRCARNDCQNTAVAFPAHPIYPQGIAIDTTRVYWTDMSGPAIVSCPISGCADAAPSTSPEAGGPLLLATDGGTGGAPFRIALDDTAIYWTNNLLAGKIMKVAKP